MSDPASSRTRNSSRPGIRAAVLPAILLVCLSVALVVGCSGGERVVDEKEPREDSKTVGESVGKEDGGRGGADSPVAEFPQHDAPLGTDDGGNYWAGRLVLDEGCLRVEVPANANMPGVSMLPIWPAGSSLNMEDAVLGISVRDGKISALVGDYVRLTHGTISYEEAQDRGLVRGIPEDCNGPYVLVGDEVTAFDLESEPTELRLQDPEVIFPRKRTVLATIRAQPLALGVGELVLDGPCLRLKDGPTIIWPAGFEPYVDRGVVQVRNGAGRVIAQVGDEIVMGGGHNSSDYDGCPGGMFAGHSIKVLPDVAVYFPKQDGTLGTDQEMERFTGQLVLDGKCLEADDVIRIRDRVIMPGGQVLLIWPESFALDLDDEVAGIVDATGRVVARVGDDIEFSAVSVSYQDAMDHSGKREIPGVCGGGYWVVGEDFGAAGDGESQ